MYDYTKLYLNVGKSCIYELILWDNDQNEELNLTGGIVRWALSKTAGGGNLVYKDTVDGGITVTNATGGLCDLELLPVDTRDKQPGEYFHYAEFEDVDGHVTPLFSGPFILKASGIY